MRQWVILDSDGSTHQRYAETDPSEDGAPAYEVKRFGDLAVERYDAKQGWVPLEAAHQHNAIDAAHLADHGPLAIELEHMRKAIEAHLIVGGAPIDGLVAAEARLMGIDPTALAQAIVEKDRAALVDGPALARRAAKFAIIKTKGA